MMEKAEAEEEAAQCDITSDTLWFMVDLRSPAMCGSQFIEDLQQCGKGPGLGLTTKLTILAILIGQLWETLPWRAEEPTKKKGR